MIKKFKNWRNLYILIAFLMLIGLGWFAYFSYNRVVPQSFYPLFREINPAQKDETILIFSPHPDDETIAAGGYIYDAEKAGAKVYIVLVTDGNKHGLMDRRYEEFRKSTGILGLPESNLIFLNHSDGELKKVDQTILKSEFLDQIDKIDPSIIIFPYPEDSHPDHAVTGKITEEEINQKSSGITTYQYLIHHRYFPQPKKLDINLYLLPPISQVKIGGEWKVYPLLPETEKKKEEAVMSYQSQLKTPFLRNLILSTIRKNELFYQK